MKQNYLWSWLKRTLCVVLILILAGQCFPMAACAAQQDVWSQDQILRLFSDNGAVRYDDTGFLMTPDELAILVSETLRENGYVYEIVYDNIDSSRQLQKYTLMWSEGWNNNGSFLPYYLQMEMDQKAHTIRSLRIHVKHTDRDQEQLADTMDSFALIFERIHGNMTEADRESFVTSRNLTKTASGYSAEGVMDALYYKLSFEKEYAVLTIAPGTHTEISPVTEYYSGSYTLYGEDGYLIRTGKLTQSAQGSITLDVELINQSKNPLLFSMRYLRIGGYDLAPSIYAQVSPGNTKTEQLYIDETLLSLLGEEKLYAVGLFFTVTDQKTGEVLFDYGDHVPLGMDIHGDAMEYSANLFKNDRFALSVVGSAPTASGSTPQIFLKLENGVYGDVILESEGNCVIGNQEYDFFASGRVSGYSSGLAVATAMIDPLDKTQTLEFDLQISSYNYNPMVAGRVTVRLDREGNILNVTSKMRETAQYAGIVEKEY